MGYWPSVQSANYILRKEVSTKRFKQKNNNHFGGRASDNIPNGQAAEGLFAQEAAVEDTPGKCGR